MDAEQRLGEKLRKIEALFAGAATAGEKSAADAAAERIRRQFADSCLREAAARRICFRRRACRCTPSGADAARSDGDGPSARDRKNPRQRRVCGSGL